MIRRLASLALETALLGGMTDAISQERTTCPSETAADCYFPKGALQHGNARSDAFEGQWFGEQLSALHEPSLSCGFPGVAVRFTWLRTFHHPVSVRVTDGDGEPALVAVAAVAAQDLTPGAAALSLHRQACTCHLA